MRAYWMRRRAGGVTTPPFLWRLGPEGMRQGAKGELGDGVSTFEDTPSTFLDTMSNFPNTCPIFRTSPLPDCPLLRTCSLSVHCPKPRAKSRKPRLKTALPRPGFALAWAHGKLAVKGGKAMSNALPTVFCPCGGKGSWDPEAVFYGTFGSFDPIEVVYARCNACSAPVMSRCLERWQYEAMLNGKWRDEQ